MTGFVNFFAPRSALDFVAKLILIELAVVLFALAVVRLIHGGFPFGLRQQVLDTAIMGLPFVVLALFVVGHQYRLQRQLLVLATTDALTGLHNRRAFLAEAEVLIASSDEAVLLLADADHFKRINDRFGHVAGDACLFAIAAHLCARVAEPRILARLGGEEFAVLLAEAPPDRVAAVAAALTAGVVLPGSPGERLTLSVGGARAEAGQSLADVMQQADRRLYAAKAQGRARAVLDGAPHPPAAAVTA